MTLNRRFMLSIAVCGMLTFGAMSAANAQSQVPRRISYQGQIIQNGAPVTGTHIIKVTYSTAQGKVHEETFTGIQLQDGIFNLLLGSSTPFPSTMDFNDPYFIAISLDNGPDLSATTPMVSAPYSLNADRIAGVQVSTTPQANMLLPLDASGKFPASVLPPTGNLTTINSIGGDTTRNIKILPGNNVTITNNPAQNSITINSTGSAITGIIAGEGLAGGGTSGNVTLQLAPNAINSSMLANGSITGRKLDPFIAGDGLVGDALGNLNVNADNSTLEVFSDALRIKAGGVGTAQLADFAVTNPKIASGAVDARTVDPTSVQLRITGVAPNGSFLTSINQNGSVNTGTVLSNPSLTRTINGSDLTFAINPDNTNTFNVVQNFNGGATAMAIGTGNAIDATATTGIALFGIHSATTGTSAGVRGETNSLDANAVGVAGVVNSASPGGFSAGIRGINNGTGGLGIGVYGSQAGSGWGVYGTTPSGIGVHGNSTNGFGLYGLSTNGTGVYGSSTNGESGRFEITNNANTNNALTGATNGAGNGVVGSSSSSGRGGMFTNSGLGSALLAQITNASSNGVALEAMTNGTGRALSVSATNTTNTANAAEITTAGTGIALSVSSTNATSSASTLNVTTAGLGSGVTASITNSGSASAALNGTTNGTGPAVRGVSTGSGNAGVFQVTNAGSTNPAVAITSNGLGSGATIQLTNASNGARGLDVTQSGVGPGVFATSAGGNAVWGITSSISSAGVIGDNTYGEAVVGRNRGGNGVGAVVGRNDSSGYGVRGFNTEDGIGVLGQSGISGGTGVAGRFENVNAANTSTTVQVATNGIGGGISVQLTNASNGGRGIDVTQSGVGPGVFATSAGGNALWGITSSISAAGVIGDNTYGEAVVGRNRGGNGVGAVVGRNDSSGYGVRGFNTEDGIGVLGQAGISGGTGVGGRFENVNAANGNDALQAATNGTGWAGNFTNANNSSGSRGVRIATTAGQGGNALTVANGTTALSYQHPYASNTVVDDAYLVVTTAGNVTVPTGPPLVDGATVWVVNNSGAVITVTNTTVGAFNINPGRACQFLFISTVSGANWIPVEP